MIKSRAMLLAGVSALAMLACAGEANAETFLFTGGEQSFPVLVSGEYSLDVFAASGGPSGGHGDGGDGGLGAEVSGDISLTAGETLTLFVGGQGQRGGGGNPGTGGGGGGGGFVFLGASVLAVAGGGGGASYVADGGPGLAGTAGGMGGGANGGAGGASGGGGGGGTFLYHGDGHNGGGGAGANPGAAGYGGDGFGFGSGSGAKFPNGGSYHNVSGGGFGGFGAGGGEGGGGGGGFSGGGGGSSDFPKVDLGSGGGGGSYLPSLFTNPILTAGVNSGDGSIDIELLKAVPEPSTWAMTLAGFAGLGWLAHMRRRKTSPA